MDDIDYHMKRWVIIGLVIGGALAYFLTKKVTSLHGTRIYHHCVVSAPSLHHHLLLEVWNNAILKTLTDVAKG